ncbi:MAG: carbohydrate kinase family protein, partial [Clostridia bacterium]|nr:carbohydrate kinase family protein [Clostridia bacterium]
RQHYYSEELLTWGLSACDIVKMNRDEFFLISLIKEFSSLTEAEIGLALQKICEKYHIKTAILTLDSDGACVWDETQGFFCIPAKKSDFVSAVGAGDSFCACFLYHYMKGHSLAVCLEKASILAGYVVSFEEAIPPYSDKILTNLTSDL